MLFSNSVRFGNETMKPNSGYVGGCGSSLRCHGFPHEDILHSNYHFAQQNDLTLSAQLHPARRKTIVNSVNKQVKLCHKSMSPHPFRVKIARAHFTLCVILFQECFIWICPNRSINLVRTILSEKTSYKRYLHGVVTYLHYVFLGIIN